MTISGLSFNITFGLYQIDNDPGIYQEEWLISGFLMWTSWSGVHADWMEQDGPDISIIGKMDIYRCETMQRLAL